MIWLKNLPIGIKLTLMVVFTTFVVLATVLALVVGFDVVTHKRFLTNQAQTLSRIASNNLTAPLSFSDQAAAVEVLNSLSLQKDVVGAVLFDSTGQEFARYQSPDHDIQEIAGGVSGILPDFYRVSSPVVMTEQPLGIVELTLSLRSLKARVLNVVSNVILLFAGGLLLSATLTFYLQKNISLPLSKLTKLAEEVSVSKNYSLRLVAESRDEVGALVNSFNLMMNEVLTRDRELESHRANLEQQVVARTAEYKRAKDEAIEASRAKSQFLANMSHEIRTPLNGILGMADLASELASLPEQREYLTILHQSSLSLLSIINDILDHSKIEAGKLELSPIQFNMRRSIERILSLMRVHATEKRIALASIVHPSVPDEIVADDGRIRQVLVNLLGNAIKFTPEGGKVTLEIGLKSDINNTSFLHLCVRDTGIGIEQAKHAIIFEAFSQADGTTSRKFGGSGLGLAISKMIVELMGGRIGVVSALGEGASFYFEIPLEVGVSQIAREVDVKPEPERFSGRNVLLVEDNLVNQKIAVKLLMKRGFQVVTAKNGVEAVDAWRSGNFEIILMDCQMPIMSGYESTRKIREEEIRTGKAPVPIIALTAQALTGDREECLRAGMNGYVSKPISSSRLFQEISKFISAIDSN